MKLGNLATRIDEKTCGKWISSMETTLSIGLTKKTSIV